MKIDFAQLSRTSESETLELKEAFDTKAMETIGAFANAHGGTILIGVRDDGHVTGITLGSTTLEEWAQKMQSKIQPRYLPSIVPHVSNGRTIMVITVERSDTPLSVEGRFIKRVGRTNQIMSSEELRQRLLTSGASSWDSQIEERATMGDLDEQAIKQFISRVKECGRRMVPAKERISSTLEKLGLIENGTPTRAALLLLGKNPQRFYTTAYIKAGRFKSQTLIVDDKKFDGPLFLQLDTTMAWFRDRLETRLLIGSAKLPGLPSGSLAERQDVWEYPLDALREAVANAICHRNYTSLATTTIRLYDDHLTIWNPGHLAFQLSPDDLLREHKSYPPNRLIAEAFYNVGIIERWGTGTLLIANALKVQRLPPPQFNIAAPDSFELLMRAGTPQPDRQASKFIPNERQQKAIEFLQSHVGLTAAQYQNLFDASKATATRDLAELARVGLVVREGHGKGTAYRLPEE